MRLHAFLIACLLTAPALAQTDQDAFKEKVFYRYINEAGVKVMHHSLPAAAAQRGYEVVSLTGAVLKVVPPALSGEEAARAAERRAEQQELDEWDASLLRRYSSADDIESAKQRKLADLESAMSILLSNMNSTQKQIRVEYARGASFERRGIAVPEQVHKALAALQLELNDIKEKYIQREWEYDEVDEKFERDKERFRQIHTKR